MCTASAAGDVAFWDLEKRKLHSELHAAHNASVTGMKCLPSQPVLVTSSSDNALKVSFTFTLQLYATAFYGVRCFFNVICMVCPCFQTIVLVDRYGFVIMNV